MQVTRYIMCPPENVLTTFSLFKKKQSQSQNKNGTTDRMQQSPPPCRPGDATQLPMTVLYQKLSSPGHADIVTQTTLQVQRVHAISHSRRGIPLLMSERRALGRHQKGLSLNSYYLPMWAYREHVRVDTNTNYNH
ncbi:uncharacterized protein LOC114355948 [Ostrinia furnacalis]|uniref:uncharacterized protein LOC114355948 n=1 Tax=Ostrinia furnacalis TaxID=93504 RepID=UPI00103C01A8|nr:uncharacterized protein LOC114355948 [Ostrinia furnacalis]